jgi:hypothetical protein
MKKIEAGKKLVFEMEKVEAPSENKKKINYG